MFFLQPQSLSNTLVFLKQDSKDELADPELDRIGSDIEDGGLDLSLPFQPITAYISDRREMLQQCFRVLSEKKLKKMLPDELKVNVCLYLKTPCCVIKAVIRLDTPG